jgi:hypothetical protein
LGAPKEDHVNVRDLIAKLQAVEDKDAPVLVMAPQETFIVENEEDKGFAADLMTFEVAKLDFGDGTVDAVLLRADFENEEE